MNSEHYKSRERLNALLRKISSDIIKRCSTKISLDDIFDGYVEKSREALKEGISCCLSWRETYDRISKMHDKFSQQGWVLDESSIFAQVDAFIQRCKDLLEVVEGQVSTQKYYRFWGSYYYTLEKANAVQKLNTFRSIINAT